MIALCDSLPVLQINQVWERDDAKGGPFALMTQFYCRNKTLFVSCKWRPGREWINWSKNVFNAPVLYSDRVSPCEIVRCVKDIHFSIVADASHINFRGKPDVYFQFDGKQYATLGRKVLSAYIVRFWRDLVASEGHERFDNYYEEDDFVLSYTFPEPGEDDLVAPPYRVEHIELLKQDYPFLQGAQRMLEDMLGVGTERVQRAAVVVQRLWRRALARRAALRVLRPAIMSWACKPGGPLMRCAMRSFYQNVV